MSQGQSRATKFKEQRFSVILAQGLRISQAPAVRAWAALTSNGLAVMQFPRLVPAGDLWLVELETLLIHTSGQWIGDVLAVPVSPSNAQAVGSAVTYARRYALAAFVGVAPEDDDGNSTDRVVRDVAADRPKAPAAKPSARAMDAAAERTTAVYVLGIMKRPASSGHDELFVVSADDQKTYTTTSADEARAAKAAKDAKQPIAITYREGAGGGRAIVSVTTVKAAPVVSTEAH